MARTLNDILSAPADISGQVAEAGPYPPPESLAQTGLNALLIEDLICKHLLQSGMLSGKELAQALCLPLKTFENLLYDLKQNLVLAYEATAGINDFVYVLTEKGRGKALLAREQSAYVGPAPVIYDDYWQSVARQSIGNEQPGRREIEQALAGLVLPEEFFSRIGPAINSRRGVFLYGDSGNGKTEVAVRIPKCFTDTIFIPKTLLIEGHLVRFYDPQCHTVAHRPDAEGVTFDRRWVEIERPAVVVGGEMDLDSLELGYNAATKVCEASLQMKGNCGIFVIDDFGRQLVGPEQLLNRWILPLEKHIDYLVLPTGSKVRVPFSALLVFCSNLDPAQLLDDAFLRRIPYKLRMEDPTEREFLAILRLAARDYGIEFSDEVADYLISGYFRNIRPLRSCYPRDIMQQLVNIALYERKKPVLSAPDIDKAMTMYFAQSL